MQLISLRDTAEEIPVLFEKVFDIVSVEPDSRGSDGFSPYGIDDSIPANAVDPRRKRKVGIVRVEVFVCFDESFLEEILDIFVGRERNAANIPKESVPIPFDDDSKGIRVFE